MSLWPEAAEMLGIGRDTAYNLGATGWLIPDQVPVWRLRGKYRVPTAALHKALGLAQQRPEQPEPKPEPKPLTLDELRLLAAVILKARRERGDTEV